MLQGIFIISFSEDMKVSQVVTADCDFRMYVQ
jgi:hypothetical protein